MEVENIDTDEIDNLDITKEQIAGAKKGTENGIGEKSIDNPTMHKAVVGYVSKNKLTRGQTNSRLADLEDKSKQGEIADNYKDSK